MQCTFKCPQLCRISHGKKLLLCRDIMLVLSTVRPSVLIDYAALSATQLHSLVGSIESDMLQSGNGGMPSQNVTPCIRSLCCDRHAASLATECLSLQFQGSWWQAWEGAVCC